MKRSLDPESEVALAKSNVSSPEIAHSLKRTNISSPEIDSLSTCLQIDLALFQKEAIWRRMKEFQQKLDILERKHSELTKTYEVKQNQVILLEQWWDSLLQIFHGTASEDTLPEKKSDFVLPEDHFLLSSDNELLNEFLAKKKPLLETDIQKVFQMISMNNVQEKFELASTLRYKESQLLKEVKLLMTENNRLESMIKAVEQEAVDNLQSNLRQESVSLAQFNITQSKSSSMKAQNSSSNRESSLDTSVDDKTNVTEKSSKDSEDAIAETNLEIEKLKAESCENIALISKLKEDVSSLNRKVLDLKDALSKDNKDYEIREANQKYQSLKQDFFNLKRENELLDEENKARASEVQVLRGERSQFQAKFLEEHQAFLAESRTQLELTEKDLARVRGARDELHSQLQVKINQTDNRDKLIDELKQQIVTLEEYVSALKKKSERADMLISDDIVNGDTNDTELSAKLKALQKQNNSLIQELPAMESALEKALKSNKQFLNMTLGKEELIMKAQAEKTKADQRYFAAMKAKDLLANELKTLRNQATNTKDIINKLQDSEANALKNLELTEKQNSQLLAQQESYIIEMSRRDAKENHYLQERNYLTEKVGHLESMIAKLKKERDIEAEQKDEFDRTSVTYKARITHLEQQISKYTKNSNSFMSDDLMAYRQMARCGVCDENFKDRTISICGHTLCKGCVDKRVQSRQRRCPVCNLPFGIGDVIQIHL